MTILITGYNGFVGRYLAKAFEGYNLIGVDQSLSNLVNKHIEWSDLDKSDIEADCIIHLAGISHDINNKFNEEEYYNINVGLTRKIFYFFQKSGANKFIFFSSVKAAADTLINNILTEDNEPKPETLYGRSKLEAEKFVQSVSLPYHKKVYIIRPCMIHGPGNKGNINLLYNLVQKGIPWPLGAYQNERSFISIYNLTYIINKIVENNIEPGIYQVSDDETISTNDLIKMISESTGRKTQIWRINTKLIEWAAKAGDLLHLPLNSDRLKKLTESFVVSNSKIKRALGIENMPYTAAEGIRKTLNTFTATK